MLSRGALLASRILLFSSYNASEAPKSDPALTDLEQICQDVSYGVLSPVSRENDCCDACGVLD